MKKCYVLLTNPLTFVVMSMLYAQQRATFQYRILVVEQQMNDQEKMMRESALQLAQAQENELLMLRQQLKAALTESGQKK